MAIEYELKFSATPEIQAEILKDLAGEETVLDMHTTYYDTPEGSLSERHYTLRRRMENGVSVCTLKAPAHGYGRGEWETRCQSIEEAVSKLCDMGAPADLQTLTAGGVIEVCGAKFTRIAKTVKLPEGVLELALDRGVLLGGGKELPLCEVEVELKAGQPALADQYAQILSAKYALVPERASKFRRALALYQEN